VHARHTIERRDEMHLARSGICEAGRNARGEQRTDESFGAIHE
jgi:hypothetical protein